MNSEITNDEPAEGIDPYQLMKIGCWKSADVFFNHYVASQPPSCVPIVIIPAAPSDIPPNSSDSSVLPAVPTPVKFIKDHLRSFEKSSIARARHKTEGN